MQTEHLTSPEVWEALLEDMPMTAMIRNLATMTRVGVVAPGSVGHGTVVEQLGDGSAFAARGSTRSPCCAALRTYAAGRGARGRNAWTPVREVVDALDGAFYAAFDNVEPRASALCSRSTSRAR